MRELEFGFVRRPRARRSVAVLMLGCLAFQTGCYTYSAAPAGGPSVGVRNAFILTDRGRAALADQIGPGVLRVEGTLVQDAGDRYVVSVARVRNIDGTGSHWSGERITMEHDHVANVQERQFSRGRTAVAIGAAVVAITVFVLTRDLLGLGDLLGDRDPPDPPID